MATETNKWQAKEACENHYNSNNHRASFNRSFNNSDITRSEVPTSKTTKIMTIIEIIMVKSNNKNIEIKAKKKNYSIFSKKLKNKLS